MADYGLVCPFTSAITCLGLASSASHKNSGVAVEAQRTQPAQVLQCVATGK